MLAIVGPTASGKSGLAERVAVELGSAVVSVDAMQVYRGMDVGTAKTPPDRRRCPLLMVDVCDPWQEYSAALFQRDARRCVDRLLSRGSVPVLCGGTGLYLDAVIDQMDFPSGGPSQGRLRWEEYARAHGPEALHAELVRLDPQSAELVHPNNVKRVVRALELHDLGRSYARGHEGLREHSPHYRTRIFAMRMDRARLYARIDARVDQMMGAGLLDELHALLASGHPLSRTASQAIGYKELIEHLQGERTLEEAVSTIKQRTRRYAKRQISWIRRDGRATELDLDRMDEGAAAGLVAASLEGEG